MEVVWSSVDMVVMVAVVVGGSVEVVLVVVMVGCM